MSTNPSQVANYAHRISAWLRNANLQSSGSTGDIYADRVQMGESTATATTTKTWELGNVASTGAVSEPSQTKFTIEENLHNSKIDMYLAGVNPTTGSGYYAANMIGQTNTAFMPERNDAGSVFGEVAIGNLRVSEIQYRFVINGACTAQYTLEGTTGSYYNVAGTFPHPLWGSPDTTSAGGINGKDARVSFGTPGAGTKAYRLQSFTIRVTYPVTHVRELGSRQEVGVMNDAPDVNVDFDLLQADEQPHDVFYGTSSDGGVTKINLTDPQIVDVFINVYDPALPESNTVLKSFKVSNCKPTSDSPISSRVRQLATSRWTLMSLSEDTVGSGNLIVSKTEILS